MKKVFFITTIISIFMFSITVNAKISSDEMIAEAKENIQPYLDLLGTEMLEEDEYDIDLLLNCDNIEIFGYNGKIDIDNLSGISDNNIINVVSWTSDNADDVDYNIIKLLLSKWFGTECYKESEYNEQVNYHWLDYETYSDVQLLSLDFCFEIIWVHYDADKFEEVEKNAVYYKETETNENEHEKITEEEKDLLETTQKNLKPYFDMLGTEPVEDYTTVENVAIFGYNGKITYGHEDSNIFESFMWEAIGDVDTNLFIKLFNQWFGDEYYYEDNILKNMYFRIWLDDENQYDISFCDDCKILNKETDTVLFRYIPDREQFESKKEDCRIYQEEAANNNN